MIIENLHFKLTTKWGLWKKEIHIKLNYIMTKGGMRYADAQKKNIKIQKR